MDNLKSKKKRNTKESEDIDKVVDVCICNDDLLISSYQSDIPCQAITLFKQKGLTSEKLTSFSKSIGENSVYYPWTEGYSQYRQNANRRFNVYPLVIVMATSTKDVKKALAWSIQYKIPLRLRGGGHSAEAFSLTEGMVLDLSRRNKISIDKNKSYVKVGAGIKAGQLIENLSQYGLALPTGTCSTVGLTGLFSGGGIGFLQRKYGLTLDSVNSFNIILANGVLYKDIREEPLNKYSLSNDLFWACRGGGGNNFGIITDIVFRIYHIPYVTLFEVEYFFDNFTEVLNAWSMWAPFIDDGLTSELDIIVSNNNIRFFITGQYVLPDRPIRTSNMKSCEEGLFQLIQPILLYSKFHKIWTVSYIDAAKHFNGMKRRPPYRKDHSTFYYKFFNTYFGDIVTKFFAKAQDGDRLEIDSLGGAIRNVAKEKSSFVHRGALFWVLITSSWSKFEENNERIAWSDAFYQEIVHNEGVGAYVNMVDLSLENYLTDYYGSNLTRLVSIKKKYDPNNVFNYQQSIPLTV